MTQPRYPEQIQPAASRVQQNSRLALHPASRLAWIEQARHLQVFVDGDSQLLPASNSLRSTLQALASGASVTYRAMARNHACLEWCQSLLTSGSLQVESTDN
jgi:hypothetical protein